MANDIVQKKETVMHLLYENANLTNDKVVAFKNKMRHYTLPEYIKNEFEQIEKKNIKSQRELNNIYRNIKKFGTAVYTVTGMAKSFGIEKINIPILSASPLAANAAADGTAAIVIKKLDKQFTNIRNDIDNLNKKLLMYAGTVQYNENYIKDNTVLDGIHAREIQIENDMKSNLTPVVVYIIIVLGTVMLIPIANKLLKRRAA